MHGVDELMMSFHSLTSYSKCTHQNGGDYMLRVKGNQTILGVKENIEKELSAESTAAS